MIVPDLRFGAAPLPEPTPGYDPAGDARALAPQGFVSPAIEPIGGSLERGSLGAGHRFVVRIPGAWNGRLVVCGTPAMRSEHANDLMLGDWLLAAGYAFASSNKGIPYNAYVEPWTAQSPSEAYRVPFAFGESPPNTMSFRFGALEPIVVPIAAWQADLPALVRAARAIVRDTTGRGPLRTYAVGLSIGGGQVRSLLEREPDLVDGGVEWASVYWHPDCNVLTSLPPFLRAMSAYVASAYRDVDARAAIVAAGFPDDRLQDAAIRSLWDAHFSALPPYYADLTTFVFARLLDPERGPLPSPAARAAYVPSPAARARVAAFAHTGRLEKPLVGIAGDADVFIPPQHHFDPYVAAVRDQGRAALYRPFSVRGGTHVDGYATVGWNLQPMLPFVWRAFEMLVATIDAGSPLPGSSAVTSVASPPEMNR
ncbi:MAG: tannase/feruloyl esterase family alpha/beta hydrolase [Vulcanimicrobiaceae bacterium]